MDAPDFDELEWMAEYEPELHDTLDQAQSMLYEEEEEQQNNTELWNQPIEVCHKRPRPSDAVDGDYKVTEHKRGKGNTIPEYVEEVEKIGGIVDDEWWSLPAPPPLGSKDSTTPQKKSFDMSFPTVESKNTKKRLADIEGDFIPITSTTGERVYAAVHKIEKQDSSLRGIRGTSSLGKQGLLSEPFEVLLEKVEQEALKKAYMLTEEQSLVGKLTSTDTTTHEQLWVEKYAPKSFTELLSDEQTNREVLRWLKEWDTCVFGAKQTSTISDVFVALRRQTPARHHGKPFLDFSGTAKKSSDMDMLHSKSTSGRKEQEEPKPSYGGSDPQMSFNKKSSNSNQDIDRPEEKILLLCGPPGLGKTTLAHVAARHCGYRVVEINASDDRVATTLQAKILDAVQMKSVMGDMRPNCVVIDEIDGALNGTDGKGAIDALLKMAFSEKKETFGKENDADRVQRKSGPRKKGSTNRLSRPIICICNDPYAPALRQLRQMARVHVFAQPSANRVVTRLKYICHQEGYKMNARALTALAEHTECDIRSCLNTLQFLKRKKEPLHMLDIAAQVVGRKDMTSSAFDIWGEIFQKRKSKNRTIRTTDEGRGQQQKEFLCLHELIANHGDYELMSEGMHDNLLQMRYQDVSLQKTAGCLEILGDSEIISHRALRNQHFALNAYQPSFALAIRHLIAQPDKPVLEWPKTSQRYRAEHSAKEELVRSWMMSMQPAIYRNNTARCLTQDFVSLLLYVLSPQTLRPVAPQLLSHGEKEELNGLVDTMIGYGINYKPFKAANLSGEKLEGHVEFQGLVLEPPIHKLVYFKDFKSGHRLLSLTLRQVLGHEVELETIRRESAARTTRATSVAVELRGLSLSEERLKKDEDLPPPVDKEGVLKSGRSGCSNSLSEKPVVLASKTEKVVVRASKPAINFFAQFRKTSVSTDKETKPSNALSHRDSRPILFKFKEGFTNAIRRPVLVRDLL